MTDSEVRDHVLPPRPKTSGTAEARMAEQTARFDSLAVPDARKCKPKIGYKGGSQTERHRDPAGCWLSKGLPKYDGAIFSLSCQMRNGSSELPTFASWSLHHGRVVTMGGVTMDEILFDSIKKKARRRMWDGQGAVTADETSKTAE